MRVTRKIRFSLVFVTMLGLMALLAMPTQASAPRPPEAQTPATGQGATQGSITPQQRQMLMNIARDTWGFYSYGVGVDPNTGLPLDNVGFDGAPTGRYTSATNIGVYLWSVVAAQDMHLIGRGEAMSRITKTITTVEQVRKWQGFLLDWYNTTNGHWVDPGTGRDRQNDPITGAFISTVDNGWYGAGLVIVRQFLAQNNSREGRQLTLRVNALLNAMNYGTFYDAGGNGRTECNDITVGQMYGGYYANQGPAGFHYGVLNTETRIGAYMGIGTHQMPGDVWWRTWRTLPSAAANPFPGQSTCAWATADFNWQGQYPPRGYWTTYNDPQSHQPFDVFEGHYVYTGTVAYGDVPFVPSWGGSMFEGLMPLLVVPETTWGPNSFGANDVTYARQQIAWATQGLGYPVWGLSPSSTPDDTGNYDAFGAVGPPYPNALSSNANCCPYQQYAVTPHASFLALMTTPQEALTNIQNLRQLYPQLYGPYAFYDAVAPKDADYTMNGHTYHVTAGQVAHRYLVLDESMIMAALDNVLSNNNIEQLFAADPIGQAVKPYLQIETFSFVNR